MTNPLKTLHSCWLQSNLVSSVSASGYVAELWTARGDPLCVLCNQILCFGQPWSLCGIMSKAAAEVQDYVGHALNMMLSVRLHSAESHRHLES
mmetsp:Transcript_9537/g.21242  ORF Transcript_9537/g.21242 Transcript_9537/m.21242 type:complete len:93 (-) Transcript_9537:7-285(-)